MYTMLIDSGKLASGVSIQSGQNASGIAAFSRWNATGYGVFSYDIASDYRVAPNTGTDYESRIYSSESGFYSAYDSPLIDCSSFACYVFDVPRTSVEGLRGTYPTVKYDPDKWLVATWGPYKGNESPRAFHAGVTYQGQFWHVQPGPKRETQLQRYIDYMRGKGRGEPIFISPW